MSEISVSIIVPIYNSEKYLEECLLSIVNQKYRNFECIMIDDGSVDGSAKIAKAYSQKDKRFKYFYQKNSGVSAARNYGLRESTGDYITFLDSDDYLCQDYLEQYINCINSTNAKIVCGGYTKDGSNVLTYPGDRSKLKGYIENLVTGTGGVVWCKVFSKDILKNQIFKVGLSMREDLLFQLELCKTLPNDITIAYLNYYGYIYRSTPESLSTNNRPLDCMMQATMEIIDTMSELDISSKKMSDFIKNIVLWDCITVTQNKKSVKEVLKSPLVIKYGNLIEIKSIRDRILFLPIKKQSLCISNVIYKIYLRGKLC